MTTHDDEIFTIFEWIYPNPILKTWITLCTLEGSCSHASYMCSVYTEELPLRKECVVWALSERVCTLAQVLLSRIPRVCGLERPEINVFTRYIFTSFWNASVFSCDKIYTYAQKPAWRFFDKSPQAQHARSNSHPRVVAVLFPSDKYEYKLFQTGGFIQYFSIPCCILSRSCNREKPVIFCGFNLIAEKYTNIMFINP